MKRNAAKQSRRPHPQEPHKEKQKESALELQFRAAALSP
jgi:hypothetical protein